MFGKTARFLAGLTILAAAVAPAQEFRALISGSVTDPSGAAVPGAAVTATNLATNARTTAKSGANGNYVLPQLAAGPYEVTAEAAGFRMYTRSGITLNVGDKAALTIRLEVGTQTDSITVNAELSGIEQNQSVLGQLMDNKRVSELPLNGRQVFMLLQLSAGVVFTQQVFGASGNSGTRAWDVGGNYTIHGSFTGTNGFVLDGSPLGVNGAWSYAPLVDAVEEFKVTAFANDASQGLTGGGVINMTMKSGTNQLHGLASEFVRNHMFDALATQTNRAAAQSPYLKNQQHQFNSFAAMISGPIVRNKLFYSGNYEGFRERVPFPVTNSVPTVEQRAGDFSKTLNGSGALIAIYDPLTTRQSGTAFARDPFPGNRVGTGRMVPVAQNVMKYVPPPNIVTDPVTGLNNLASSPNIGQYRYDQVYTKFDYILNERHHTFASYTQNYGEEYRSQTGFPKGNPARMGPDPNNREHMAATLDHVWNVRPSTVLNVRISGDRYYFKRGLTTIDNFDGSTLGFQGPSGANPVTRFPNLTFTNYANVGANVSRTFQPNDVYTVVGDVSRAAGRHFIKTGARIGQARFSRNDKANYDGLFAFTAGWTQRNPQSADATSGHAIASFLLGYPASGSAVQNPESTYENKFIGLFIQDDFKASRRLMLNLGLRWDVQTPSTERFDRTIVGFDPNATYTLGKAQAKGGVVFASPDRRKAWPTRYRDVQPRIGAAYRLTNRLVWRSSYGLSFLPVNGTGGPSDIQQNGFSRTTPLVATIGGGLNSYIPGLPGTGTLTSPFPGGILQPFGAALGPKTQVGQAITYMNPDFATPRVHQFSFGFDYELPAKTTVEASFVGSRTRKYGVNQQTDGISLEDRLKGFADPNYLNATVPNPFAGAPELDGTGLSAANTTRSQVSRPFPQFTGVTVAGLNVGNSSYNALEMRVNKRMSRGLTVTGAYTWSKTLQATAFREIQYGAPERVIAGTDRSQHLSVQALYSLPIGRGKAFGRNWGRAADAILGNWQYNFILEEMTGTPTAMPDATPVRDPRLPGGEKSFDRWFNTCTLLTNGQRSKCASADEPVAWVQLRPNELRTYSSNFPNLRNPWRVKVDMSLFKVIPIRERVRMEFRAEAFNAFNTPIYAGPATGLTTPNFGVVVRDQQNFPRNMQFALRLRF